MANLVDHVIGPLARDGTLEVIDGAGHRHVLGCGGGTPLRVRFTDRASERAVLFNPQLKLGEAYMDGRFIVERGTLYEVLDLVGRGLQAAGEAWWMRALSGLDFALRRLHQYNPARRARANVAHHYDLDSRLYDLFLDADRQYSCAYFEDATDDLDTAQRAKKRHIAAKLALRDGHRVLDIGSGWGGLGLYLARHFDVAVTGVTLSTEQHAISRRRAEDCGLASRVDFRLTDYRMLDGPFDRIVSVGMFEHVGVDHYRQFFDKARALLKPDGVMLLHAIGRTHGPGFTNPFIRKHIFPGGYIPALSEVLPAIERAGLVVSDLEILRLHYAETLRLWRERFLERRHEAVALYDERFARMWEFYLVGSELAFRHGDLMVFQIQLVRDQKALPLTRGYMAEREAALAERDSIGEDRARPAQVVKRPAAAAEESGKSGRRRIASRRGSR